MTTEWPTSDRIPARKDGDASASQIALLTGLETSRVVGLLSDLKVYGEINVAELGFGWETDEYHQTHLSPERAARYIREVLLDYVAEERKADVVAFLDKLRKPGKKKSPPWRLYVSVAVGVVLALILVVLW